jgi:Protein of unknown function DUF262/Protein of unknown function (DUF1524)
MAFENAALSTVEEIRSTYRMVVPEYQRGYAWGEEQWRALWNDAENVVRRSHREHYAGAMMVSTTGRGDSSAVEAELIDGQQRWTSMALMLKALGHEAYAVTYRNNEPLQTYFDYYAQGLLQLGPRLAEYRSYYTRNLEEAAEYFRKRAQVLDEQQRLSLIEALLQRFKIFILGIQPSFDVHVAFETINNRGKPLSTLEKLKNRLIYLAANATNHDVGVSATAEIHRCWKGVYTWLGQGRRLLDDDEFLRAHALGWFRHEKRADWLASQLFDEEFSANADVPASDIERYVRSLEHSALWWHRLNEPVRMPGSVALQLAALQRTASSSSRPLLLWALIRLAEQMPAIDANPESESSWCEPFNFLARQAERFAVLVVLANDRLANLGQSDINRSAYALAHPGEPLNAQDVHLVPPLPALGAVQFAGRHMQALVDNRLPASEDYRDSQFGWPGYYESERVRNVVADRMRKASGFYNWQFGKLLIYLWEEHLRGEKGLPEKRSWETISWDETVEHIYPRSPGPEWADAVSFDGRTSDALRGAVTNSPGNLMLLSRGINSTLSNHTFRSDGTVEGKAARYAQGSYSEVQVASLCKQWTVVQIAARGIAMWRLAQRIWKFEVVSDDARLSEWLPFLFGDQAERIVDGAASGGRRIDGRALQPWVEKFERYR